ncbi:MULTISPECIES: helix-turn-helix domain-containing protein [unclassified Haladaptatus]|uniref:winged helix-turn-helix domain-containing protein n=1 Tax=unclassified Haladaptatus TaxID=2622732 RepID=UPI0007B4DB71|nr:MULTISPECIES: helix-turn-helix domain-containing protein [unclassified Haladaptatus]KZN26179.1 IclR family transcriptional regulator [Haladaptatus sp. R4]MCO8246369.1 helix-turn-helix domain-containing protein [Haladaptatus sp. AB643]MCO8255272.1 helix-turn-helix domain-containing protein [Haladaptatus sp. AB618]
MVRDLADDTPDLQDVLDALDDPACRRIIMELREPMTAREVADATDIPLSTLYRKLDLLSEAALVAEETEIREDGHHTSRYRITVESVNISITEDGGFQVTIDRPPKTTDERLERLWTEIRKET